MILSTLLGTATYSAIAKATTGSVGTGTALGLHAMGGVFYNQEFVPGESVADAKAKVAARSYRADFMGLKTSGDFAPGTSKINSGFNYLKAGKQTANPWGMAFSALAPIVTAGVLISGYQENGFLGAMEAGIHELSAATAGAHYGYKTVLSHQLSSVKGVNVVTAGARTTMVGGIAGAMGIGMAAYTGYDIGKEYLGVPGGVLGAFGGAKLAQMLVTGGRSSAIAIGIGAGIKAVDFGIGYVQNKFEEKENKLRIGEAYIRSKRGIDTANSTASFYTMNANTMRSRAVMAMRNSHLNARSALGQEATFMHSSRDYFSRYRR